MIAFPKNLAPAGLATFRLKVLRYVILEGAVIAKKGWNNLGNYPGCIRGKLVRRKNKAFEMYWYTWQEGSNIEPQGSVHAKAELP